MPPSPTRPPGRGATCSTSLATTSAARFLPARLEVDRLGTPHTGDIKVSPPMAENLRGLAEMGLMGLALPREYGGEGMPFVVNAGVIEMLARADAATMVQYAFYSSPATMILRFGSDAQKQRWVPRLASGEIIGWVAMTEPRLAPTSATSARPPLGKPTARGGSLAASSSSPAAMARSVSCWRGRCLAPEAWMAWRCSSCRAAFQTPNQGERENFEVERAEEKVCINGSPTCALAFVDSYAEILGSPGDGWHQITTFMNEARIAVGIQACGVAQASLVAAQDYAAQRVQMKSRSANIRWWPRCCSTWRRPLPGLRALWMESAVAYDLVRGLDLRLRGLSEVDPERPTLEARKRRLERYLRELTPLVKYFGAEEAIRVARMGMQVFGGYGVVKDYDVERFLRDSLILPIYEGTSQIQSLMATKDLLKAIVRNPRSLLVPGGHSPWLTAARFDGEIGRTYRGALRAFGGAVSWLMVDLGRQVGPRRAAQLMRGGTAELDDTDLAYVLLSAERLTQMLAYLHIGRLLAQQAQRWPERRPLAERFLRRASDVCGLNAKRIMRGDRDVLEAIQQWHTATA